ncbi:MAG: nucleotidyl transferase AbiEii/AbiGii toxin family protein [Chlamydiae bacterium]|nr:nucleotidyl transferase AbiEii/AbiGii toxin family protein [Chlamydiota bacterium]MBI3276414.1 nucleotidyl transferase AbiEii/AbiGii toxin family protein [Chlamydiota bacterium]
MEKIKKWVQALCVRPIPASEQEIVNQVREYLQILILKIIYQSKFGHFLSFMGGTSLRICYDLKRYSEDLDFCLDEPSKVYDFSEMIYCIQRELSLLGFSVSTNVHQDKTVQKAFVRIADIGEILRLKTFRKNQKLHIKVEVDIRPIPLEKGERESFFVNRFQEIFPILKHNLPTLFAGKILAILQRPYERGRDYYDLIWYLGRKTPVNLDYLNRGRSEKPFTSWSEVLKILEEKIKTVKPRTLLKDLQPFLEDPSEEQWILKYQDLFEQLRQ